VLNAVFLHHNVKAGLDLAIVNTQMLTRFASISKEELEVCDHLLANTGDDPIAAFAAFFRGKKAQKETSHKDSLPLLERLPLYIVEGSKDGLYKDLDEALQTMKPLEIINGPLMKGMDEVGRLFNNNELIVAEVLQSAEAMKAAVDHLKPHMEKSETSSQGKVLLATVKGDVHDIGKNLVDIILSNNGFEVVNLGIKIPSDQLIEAVRSHKPDIIGLSGLLVKSAQQMQLTADDLCRAGIDLPVMVGGAALSEEFTNNRIAPSYPKGTVLYAKDAMNGLDLARKIINPKSFEELKTRLHEKQSDAAKIIKPEIKKVETPTTRSSEIEILSQFPEVQDFEAHTILNTPLEQIWSFLNPLMLYSRHLGMKGKVVKQLWNKDFSELSQTEEGKKQIALWEQVEEVKHEIREQKLLQPKALYQFFAAASESNTLNLYPHGKLEEKTSLTFPRQQKENGWCLADFTAPLKTENAQDAVCLFVVTAGTGVRELAEQWKNEGKYFKSHALQAIALETAEAYAELLHAKIRGIWGFADKANITMMERFQAKYRGCRFSFGYPACPQLEDQKILFDLLHPETIGVQLTEGFMMDPEASVSAIVFHHPQAKYFAVGS